MQASAPAALAGQRPGSPWRLRFAPALEADFLRDYRRRGILLARFTVAAAFVLHLATVLVDRVLLGHQLILPWAVLGMYGLALPMVTAYAVLAFAAREGVWLFRLAPYIVAVNGIGVSLALLAPDTAATLPALPSALILANPLFALLLSGMLLRAALPTAGVVVGWHFLLMWALAYPLTAVAADSLVVLGSVGMSVIGGWQIEKWQRAAWLREREFRRLADRDQLTGLASRHYLFQRGESLLRETLSGGRPFSVLMIDVDHFKQYNDRFGHVLGDDCLRRIAAAVHELVDGEEDIAARFGGEEFVVLLPGRGARGALTLADALRLRIEDIGRNLDQATSEALQLSASVGVVTATGDGDLDVLIGRADDAMYRAKRGGRNRVVQADG